MVGSCVACVAAMMVWATVQPPAKTPKAARPPSAPQPQATPTTVVSNSLGFIIQRGTEQGVEVAEEGRGWVIRDGEMKLGVDQLVTRGRPVDAKLQVNRFATTESTVVVKVDVSPAVRPDAFMKAMGEADKQRPPTLVDTLGRKYEAVGFTYTDSQIMHLRFTVGSPLKGLSEAPSVSLTTPDRHLTLVFRASLGVEIKEFRIGDAVLEKYEPTIKCDQKQK